MRSKTIGCDGENNTLKTIRSEYSVDPYKSNFLFFEKFGVIDDIISLLA